MLQAEEIWICIFKVSTLLLFSFFFEWRRMEHFSSLKALIILHGQRCIVICCFKLKGKIRIADTVAKVCDELYVIRKYFLYTEF